MAVKCANHYYAFPQKGVVFMKSIVKKIMAAVLAMMMLTLCIPQTVEAKDSYSYEVTSLKQNKWITLKSQTSEGDGIVKCYMYKMSVPANGYVKIESSNADVYVGINTELKKNTHPSDLSRSNLKNNNIYYRVLPKGACYIYKMYGGSETTRIRWSFIKASNPSNFCRAKARKLGSGKKETIVFNEEYEYDRWYKITLKKTKPITVYLKGIDDEVSTDDFCVYTSKGARINCPEYETGKSFRTPIQKKGTYYIRITKRDPSEVYSYDYATDKNIWGWNRKGRIRTLSWK